MGKTNPGAWNVFVVGVLDGLVIDEDNGAMISTAIKEINMAIIIITYMPNLIIGLRIYMKMYLS